jgi:alpha-L-fucosidase
VDHVILAEDCRYGQRVRAFRLEGRTGSDWQLLYSGTSIGHKRIIPVEAHAFQALRLVVTETQGEPHLRRFAAFNTGAPAPPTWDAPAEIWAADAVGNWDHSKFEVDLSKKVTEATQYRLRFVPESGRVRVIGEVRLQLDGTPAPGLTRLDPAAADALILTITGIGQKVVASGTINVTGGAGGAERGTILMQKL